MKWIVKLNRICVVGVLVVLTTGMSSAQAPFARYEDPVPQTVENMYRRGLRFLAATQQDSGAWKDDNGRQPGVIGLAVLAFLAHGEDPNAGPNSTLIKRGLTYIIKDQETRESGMIGSSMYNHGFATLALAEAYGTVDDPRIAKALGKAVKLLLSSQANNPHGAWRYDSGTKSADTTVSGACLVALLATRNAGIEVPDKAIRKALDYYKRCQNPDGGFGYTSAGGSSPARGAIGTLAFALSRKRKSSSYRAASNYLKTTRPTQQHSYHYYYLYYASQAFFHGDPKGWKDWNKENINLLKQTQQTDGSWQGSRGATFSTASALLSLALNYRLLPIYER